ncbi:DUF2798 domain-containing protein [Pleomorphovibrio marinus]|uniref:hypothetical protein n=1 Tax=Pleomorphovibrio marinus TaxID=2164132 RepID=UPI001E43A0E0|nr:hypothetical protein [Pleomorphovibrio marinus]
MKRIQLFEFEDQIWFPIFLRNKMTLYLVALHSLIRTARQLENLVDRGLQFVSKPQIVDLGSGAGGPIVEVFLKLKTRFPKLNLMLTDFHPNTEFLDKFNAQEDITYGRVPTDATLKIHHSGLRTMISCFHHFPPDAARNILLNAQEEEQPILIFEISDNSFPKWLWWTAFPVAFVGVFFITPKVRPFTWQQFLFTYLIPLLPLFIAWDGAVSNARTYTIEDLKSLIDSLPKSSYQWETGKLSGKGGNKIYLLGYPSSD